jgi:preprotein translocase subunit SecE
MRIEPVEKSNVPLQERIDRITKVVAIVVAFISTFFFFIKILFL